MHVTTWSGNSKCISRSMSPACKYCVCKCLAFVFCAQKTAANTVLPNGIVEGHAYAVTGIMQVGLIHIFVCVCVGVRAMCVCMHVQYVGVYVRVLVCVCVCAHVSVCIIYSNQCIC